MTSKTFESGSDVHPSGALQQMQHELELVSKATAFFDNNHEQITGDIRRMADNLQQLIEIAAPLEEKEYAAQMLDEALGDYEYMWIYANSIEMAFDNDDGNLSFSIAGAIWGESSYPDHPDVSQQSVNKLVALRTIIDLYV